jgi:large repetitive protein
MAFRRARRAVSRATAAMLLISVVAVGTTVTAPGALAAAGTVLFNQPFHDDTLDGPAGSVVLPATPTKTNVACLSAAGNATANPLASCSTATDAQGSGKLRLTSSGTGLEGGVFASTSVPTSQGLDITFNSYQYGGSYGADGIAFVLAATDPANPAPPAVIGQTGGALGYSAENSTNAGLAHGYLGIGIDPYGNFSNKYEGTGCTDPANIAQRMPGQVVVRGPGNGTVGYCALQSSAATATSPALTLRATTRAASTVPVEVVYNPGSSPVTTPSGLTVPAGDYDVTFTPVGGTARSLVGALPVVPSGLYPSSWVTASGFPRQLTFGWVASTGANTDYHEIDNALVNTLNPVPQLAVSQTSYSAAALTAGSPVTYKVAASSSGVAENFPVTVTETLPSGVLPAGASGPGWVCGAPSGQQISCTNSTSPFTSGAITVNGVVNSGGVTQALVQSGASAVASSSDGGPATSSSAPAGTVPAAPSVTSISPANGTAGGGSDVTVTGTNLGGATAIEIGTAAEFTAGTPTTLNLCASAAPGCFTATGATSLDISSMPAHAAASVQVSVVSLGIAGSGAYTYNAGPALLFPAPPGGEAGVAYSDQLTVTGGTSPFTWSVSVGALPAGVTLGASTGLLSGTPTTAGAYSFTVKVIDHAGLTATEPVSLTVIAGPSLSFPAPPAGWTNTVYSDTLTETGGTGPFTWSVSSGSLPAGISLSADGNLTGTPTATGSAGFTVKVTDTSGQSATQATSITISAGVSTTFSAPPAAVVGTAYTDTLTAAGGTTPYTWSVNAGTLPAGLTLSSAGVLAGTPTTAGSYPFTVNVVDQNNGIATASITLVVGAGLTLTFGTPPGGQVGTAYTDTLTAAGGTTPYAWSVSAGTLPAGITLNASTGVLAGTPTAGGTSNFTVKVTDATGLTATHATSITVLAGALTIVQSANVATTTPGSKVGYTIKVTNTGQIALTGATLTDPLTGVLDDATYNSDASATAGTVSFASPNLTWTGNLAIGASATITYSVTVNNPDAGNQILASTITSTTSGSNCAAGSTDPNCALAVPVSMLTITGTASVSTATPGATVSYTITVTNSGQVAYASAGFTDALSGVLDDATYNLDGTATAGSLSFTSPNLTWTGSLAIGATATITFSVTVNSPDTGNKVLASTISSTSAGNNCASGSTDTRCASTVTVLVPGLTIALTANTASTTPGSTVGYTLTVTNSGQTAYTGATFIDQLDGVLTDAAYNGNATATTGNVSFTSPDVTWSGNLAVGATATVTFSVTVNNPDTGDKLLTSSVISATAGSTCPSGGTDPRCASSIPVLVPGLNIGVSAGSGTTTPGAVVHYTVTVTNSGQTPYTGATFTDPLAGVLDDAAYNGDAAATAGTVSFTSPNLTWTGNLAVGATATVTFSVTVGNPDTGNKILASTVTSATTGSNCAAGSGAAACIATVNVAVLTIVNGSTVSTTTPGSVVRFTATFTNSGQVPYTGITIASNITDVLDDATPNGDQTATSGTLTLTATGISWTGSIPVGGTVTVTGTVTVNNPDPGNKVMTSTLSTSAAGSNCPSGGTDPRCTTTVTVLIPAMTITQSAGVATTTPGSVVHYTVTVTDTGQTPYTGATFTDQLDGVLADAAYNGDAAATAGTVSYASPDLTWTGNLAPGAVATITFSVTVNNPDNGDKSLTAAIISATAGSNCPVGGTDARCTAVVQDLVPGLDIVASVGAATATPGAAVQYTITVTNTGNTPYTAASFTDPLAGVLDDAAYHGDAAATAGTVSFASPNLTWTGNLAVGATATITFSVTVSTPDTGNGILTGTITSTAAGNNCPAGTTDVECTTTVTVAQLTIVNTANVPTTTPGGVVRYTATFTNTGQVPYTGITISSNITDVVDDATPNGDQTATSGTLTLTSTGISWTGSIPVGGTVTVTGTVTVKNPDPGNNVMTSTLSTSAAGSNCPSGGTDLQCTATVTVLTPALSIVKTANASSAVPGQVIGYTVTVTDTGQTPYTAAQVTDDLTGVLGDAAYDNDAATTAGSLSYASPNLTWTGNLAPGAAAVITYTVTVNNPGTGDKLVINTVSSTATGSTCPPGTTAAACRVTVAVLTPALTIVKTATTTSGSNAVATPGGIVTYTITVTNTGQVPYTGASFTDPLTGVLDDAVYNGDAAATAGTVSYASPNLTWTGNLAVGAAATITYTVTVNNPDTGNRTLTGTVTSATTGSNCPAVGGDARCTVTVTIVGADSLTFTQTAAASAVAGQVVHYTITIVNSAASPYTGASFTDPLTGVLDDAAYNGDAAATAGTVSYASPTLSWSGNVPANSTVTITYTVTVNNPDTGNMILASTISSPSSDSNCPAGSPGPRCTATVTVSQLAITFAPSASTTTPGGIVRITTTLANTGQTPYFGITVTFNAAGIADDATGNGDQTATSGTLVVGATGGSWTGDIPVGGTVTITSTVTVNNPDTGDHTMTGTAVTTAPGSNCPAGSTDPACTAVTTVLTPALTIVKTASTTAVTPGTAVSYTIVVTDTGQTPYAGATVTDDLTGVLDDAAYNGDAAATAGTVSYASPVLTWTGPLAAGASATITYSVTTNNPPTDGKLLVNAAVSSDAGSTCPPASQNTACAAVVTVLTPALTITTTAGTATTAPGSAITYTLTIADTGQTPYAGTTVTDDLTGVLDDAAYNHDAAASTGTLSYASPDLTWTGSLAPGATATITYTVTVSTPDTGDHILASTVTSTAAGSNCPAASTDPRCGTRVTASQLTISNTADTATTTPGSDVHYTVTATNTGQNAYIDATFTIDVSDVFEDAAYNGDVAATSGSLTSDTTAQTETWTGDLAPGASVTVTFSVTVTTPDTDAGDNTFTETADSTTPGNNCPPGGTDPACAAIVTVLVPGLTITNTPSASAAVPGATIGYTLTIADSGQTPYTGITVTDDLTGITSDAAYNGDAAATVGAVSYASPVLTWTGDLTPGATATVTFSITVNNPDTGDKVVVTTASSAATGSSCPPGTTAAGCRSIVTVLTPALTITAAATPATATPGGTVSYTITVTNTGQTPYSGATFTDPLAGVLDDAAYNSDAAATAGTVAFAGPNLTWTGSLAPGAAATITFTVTVSNPDTGDHFLASTLTSATPGNNCLAGSTDPRCATTIDVAALRIVNTASVSTTTPGEDVAYTITVTNTGQVTDTGITVTDPLGGVLDDAVYNSDTTTTVGSAAFTSPNLTWTGSLAPGAAATITFTVTVNSPDTGDKILTSTMTSAAAGNNCPAGGTDPACTATVTVLIPSLAIAKTAAASTTTPGSTVGYTITVTDTGPTPYTAATVNDALDGVLPDAAYNKDATVTSGTLTFISPDLIWTGNLIPGQTATITYTVTIANPDTGDKHLINIATSDDAGSNCPTGTANPACIATVIDLIPALTVTKTANVSTATPGSAVGYTITVADTGQTPYTAAQVTDSLSGVLGDAAYNNDATASTGTVSYASPVLTWTGDLTPGQTATIGYSVTVSNPDAGGRFLSNSVVSTAPGSTCPSGNTSPGCTVTVAVVAGVLSITTPASGSLGSAAPGGTISANLGTVQVTDNRGFGANWTATVATTTFITGTGIPVESISAGHVVYDISALSQATGSATFTFVPATTLSTAPQAVVSATNVAGNTSAAWNPLIKVSVPSTVIAGLYTATITHSVS